MFDRQRYRLRRLLAVASLVAGFAGHPWRPAQATDWPTYGFDSTRRAYNDAETALSPATVTQMRARWTFDAGAYDTAHGLDGAHTAFTAQPVVAAGVPVNGVSKTIAFVGDNNGMFFALDVNAASSAGSVIWSRPLGNISLACNDFGQHYGVLSSGVISRTANGGRGLVYVAANDTVYALDLATGVELSGWPVKIPNLTSQEAFFISALTLNGNNLYVANAASCKGTTYHGQLALIDVATHSFVRHWWTIGGTDTEPSALGGSIWGPGGASYDPADTVPGIYTTTGNGLPYGSQSTEQKPFAESFVKLSNDLRQTLDTRPPPLLDYNGSDFGSTPVLVKPKPCGGKTIAVALNKTGFLYAYDAHELGKSTGQALRISTQYDMLVGDVAYDPVNNILVAISPQSYGAYSVGPIAFQFNSACQLVKLWNNDSVGGGSVMMVNGSFASPPTIANGVVYFGTGGDYLVGSKGGVATVVAVNEKTGAFLWRYAVVHGAMAAPTVVNGVVLEGGFDHLVHAWSVLGK